MNDPRTAVRIRFGSHSVAITSEASQILEGIRDAFSFMISHEPCDLAGRFTVRSVGEGYAIEEETAVDAGHGSQVETLHALRYSMIQHFMDARDDLVWFHGGAAASSGRAVLLPGPRGRGKSTLVDALCARGWEYVSDDVLPVAYSDLAVEPFPQTPAFREHPGEEKPEEWLLTARKRVVRLDPRQVCDRPQRIGAFVFPAYQPGASATIEPRSPATAALALLEGCWDFPRHRERAVERVAELADRIPAYDVTFSDGAAAAALVAETLRER